MRVSLQNRYVDSYKSIAREANKAVKNKRFKARSTEYERALLSSNISVENKKKKLAKHLHDIIIKTFSVNIAKVKGKEIENIKKNTHLIRQIIQKIEIINNYFEESLLREMGIIEKPLGLKAVKVKKPENFLERKRGLSKGYIGKIEHTVYNLMQDIIFFDEKLLKGYRKKETITTKKEKLGIKDLENILKTESELLNALEAKIPPPNKIRAKLFRKEIFNKWVPYLFALLSSFETEYGREKLIFSKIKKNYRLRKKIESKIKHIVNEKERMLKIREKRALSMKTLQISDNYRQAFHDYASVVGL